MLGKRTICLEIINDLIFEYNFLLHRKKKRSKRKKRFEWKTF